MGADVGLMTRGVKRKSPFSLSFSTCELWREDESDALASPKDNGAGRWVKSPPSSFSLSPSPLSRIRGDFSNGGKKSKWGKKDLLYP